ncbi:MAG: DUF1543 domain-containing protein [Bacteroidota bacterium]|nr:DUF1543 domain-containing protein [Bacteroidota bacterium]
MKSPQLFMLLLGCKPKGRHTEQHDIFMGVGDDLSSLLPDILQFWPGDHKIHIDAWRTVTEVDGFEISIQPRDDQESVSKTNQLYFLNLGGYREGEFDELHYRMLVVAPDKAAAIHRAKKTAFFQHTGFTGANAHIDDTYGVDVDDIYLLEDILPPFVKEKYKICIRPMADKAKDSWQLGYLKLSSLAK